MVRIKSIELIVYDFDDSNGCGIFAGYNCYPTVYVYNNTVYKFLLPTNLPNLFLFIVYYLICNFFTTISRHGMHILHIF
jgi:hypothetical protein